MSPLALTRPFAPDDLRALYAIEEACFEPTVRFSRALMRSLATDPDCRVWMGILDEVRVGFAIVSLRGRDEIEQLIEPAAAYIWTIEVLPAFRRKGVAAALLACVEQSAGEAACTAIELHVAQENSDAVALYERAGYQQIGIIESYYGRGLNGLHYRKTIHTSDF